MEFLKGKGLHLLFLFPLFFSLSCDYPTEVGEDKVFKEITESLSDSTDQRWIYKSPNGAKRAEFEVKNGKFHGMFKEYYSNGKLARDGRMYQGRLCGTVVDYDSIGGFKKKYTNYIMIGSEDSTLVNEVIYFKAPQIIDSQAANSYYETHIQADTIQKGEPFEFSIRITHPAFNNFEILICDFDEYFILAEGEGCISNIMDSGEITLQNLKYKPGINVIRGVIISTEPSRNIHVDSKAQTTTYFELPYYVRE